MLYPLLISTIAGFSTMFGALIILFKFKEKNINKLIVLSLSLSSIIMIGISITELIPASFFHILFSVGIVKGQYVILFTSLLGYLIIIVINKLMNNNDKLYKLGILSLIALIIHNLPEGIATFMASYKDVHLGVKLAISIILHNIPEGLAIAVPIYYSTKSKVKAFKFSLLASLAEPIGALITYIFLKNYITDTFLYIILLFVGVTMITLAIRELFPKAISYNNKQYVNIGVIMGIIIIILNFLFF